MTLSLRAWIEIIAALIIVAGVIAWTMHERSVGREQIAAADAIATQKAQAAAKVQTDAMAAQATKAAQEASHAQAILNAYMVQFPVDGLVCSDTDHRGPSLPSTTTARSGTESAGTQPIAIQPVPAGGAPQGSNIGPELGTILQVAGRLAVLNHEFQTR